MIFILVLLIFKGGNCSPLISAPINATQPALPISEEYSSSVSVSPVVTDINVRSVTSSPVTRIIYVTIPTTSTSTATTTVTPSTSTSTTISPSTTTGLANVTEEVVVTTVVPSDNSTDNVPEETTTVGVTESVQVHEARQAPTGNRTGEVTAEGGLDSAGIAGICFGTLVVLALGGAVSFVLYRRRYLNKPQTLNDKCSNPDSSGYIDDSTIRENSEEMYSLDNDSFLNSLEAMTIQNYWTDTVKHTKL